MAPAVAAGDERKIAQRKAKPDVGGIEIEAEGVCCGNRLANIAGRITLSSHTAAHTGEGDHAVRRMETT
ncbi:MAG: hypothetical protein WAV72_12470 [Bradyrhizobium sp.]